MHVLQDELQDAGCEADSGNVRPASVSMRDVSFFYPSGDRAILRNINLEVPAGQFVVITGPSGCGKSTLAAAMSGYIPHVIKGSLLGEILIHGRSTLDTALSDLAVQVSLCQQDPESQLCTLSVREEVAFGPENLGLPVHDVLERMESALEAVHALDLLDRCTHELSGGEMQRVALASMLAMRPGILILDEPTASLDPDGAEEVFLAIENIRQKRAITVIVIEHRTDRLMRLADRTICMENGAIVWDGPPAEVVPRRRIYPGPAGGFRIEGGRGEKSSEAGTPEVVRVNNLRFAYEGREILRGISFQARQGELVGIIGPNGSGKSTFLGCLAGLCRPISGDVHVGDIDVCRARTSAIARRVGFVFQNPNHQIFANTVWEELTFACDNFGISRAVAESSARDAMERFGIAAYAAQHPLRLSHGEKRRLNLCSAIPHDPRLIVLDEPFVGQDRANRLKILDNLKRLKRTGKTLLVVSHDMSWVYDNCDRIVLFGEGRIRVDDTPNNACKTIESMGAFNFLPGTVWG